jgi:hypothetical protein
VGPRAGVDAVVKRKIPSPLRESKPKTPIVQPVSVIKITPSFNRYDSSTIAVTSYDGNM